MEFKSEIFRILGIMCYLNYPKYLTKSSINCVDDIYEKIEEKIEEIAIQIDELEENYSKIINEKDKLLIINQINNKKITITDLQNQLNFIKN